MRPLTKCALVACLLTTSPIVRASTDFGHAATLPRLNPGVLLDAVAGEAPSSTHPQGTVIVAASTAACGPALLEWDVARQRVLRQACLGLPEADMRLARTGATLQVLANASSLVLEQVDVATFRVRWTADLGGVCAEIGLATDGALTVVASRPLTDASIGTWTAVTVDAGGHVLGRITRDGLLGGPVEVSVLAGRAFVVLRDDPPTDPKPRLVALRPDATIAREIALDGPSDEPSLAVKGNRLLVGTGREVLEVSPNLDVLARHPASVHGQLAVSSDGHVLTSHGEILNDAFTAERSISPNDPWVHALLWLGSTPVMIGSYSEVVRYARVHWWDPS